MSDPIHHYCGLALIRLRKPLSYYRDKYGSPSWGLDKLQLLMIKQRNRGQDGAGVAVVKFDAPAGEPYMMRKRSDQPDSVHEVFDEIHKGMQKLLKPKYRRKTDRELKHRFDFLGELYLGHLRYGTHGESGLSACHPYLRQSNWQSRNLALAGNFNLTNASEILAKLATYGLHTVGVSDTLTILEKIGHFLDVENERILNELATSHPELTGQALAQEIGRQIDVTSILQSAARDWDGGYTFASLIGNGDAFVCRDPHGIRPAFYYDNDEVFAMASEKAALTTVFNVEPSQIQTVRPGHAIVIKRDGTTLNEQFREPAELPRHCSFERIYFSRGNDPHIYAERKKLGSNLARAALKAVKGEIEKAVFSFVPNTAETAFLGLVQGLEKCINEENAQTIVEECEAGNLTKARVQEILARRPRVEKAAHKDAKVRTFIAQDNLRGDLVSHVYDITRHCVDEDGSLVVLDDSIVRGTTLRDSIITMLSRLKPRRIVILSSAPPIKYPDCYGIDMSELGRFIAFQAAIRIVKTRGDAGLLDEVYHLCKSQAERPSAEIIDHVSRIYDGISDEQLSATIADLVRPADVTWQGELKIVYQTIDGLRDAIPNHTGDWYFTGDYPTPGGFKVLNTAYINYYENRDGRSY